MCMDDPGRTFSMYLALGSKSWEALDRCSFCCLAGGVGADDDATAPPILSVRSAINARPSSCNLSPLPLPRTPVISSTRFSPDGVKGSKLVEGDAGAPAMLLLLGDEPAVVRFRS